MRRVARFALALSAFAPALRAQTDLGVWEAPFNHEVPTSWIVGQPDWDGEARAPYTFHTAPRRYMAAHMALIPVGPHRGKVLVWNWMRVPANEGARGHQHWAIADLAANPPTFLDFDLRLDDTIGDLFCSGHTWTKDGHLFVAGGDRYIGTQLNANHFAFRFDPLAPTGNQMWVREPDMAVERWYPSTTTMGTDAAGRDLVIVTGGWSTGAGPAINTYEVFDPSAPPGHGTWQINPVNGSRIFPGPAVGCSDELGIYPRQFLLSSGKLFFAGMTQLGYRLDHSQVALGGASVWEIQAGPSPSLWRDYASAFLVPNVGGPTSGSPDVVMRVGGGDSVWTGCVPDPAAYASMKVQSCAAGLASSDPNWKWNDGPPLTQRRYHQNAVLLPDGSVVVVGGNLDPLREQVCAQPVLATELFNDLPGQWRTLVPATVRRGYHSASVLLPDGRVVVGGGEQREMDYEILEPHYLTNGTRRPTIVNAPTTLAISYGQSYSVDYAPLPSGITVERAVLMAPGSVTHHTDFHQHYVELEQLPPSGAFSFSFKAPANSNLAPRGFYMLFLVSNVQPGAHRGTPSTATWVHLQ